MEKFALFENGCKGIEVPTDDEVEALKAMKTIKIQVREIKQKISETSSDKKGGDVSTLSRLERDLEKLKKKWIQWEEKRKKAARERMIRLGHEEEDKSSE